MGFIKDFPYKKGEIILDKNDTLILFTDGITEAYSPDKEQFGEKRLEKVILSTKSSSVDNMCSGIIKKVRSFEDNKHFDDATILIFRRD
jgi:phosphoserine phosphatase RsbU/P